MKFGVIAAALAGLAIFGEPDDAEIARRWLAKGNSDASAEAAMVLARFGRASDATILANLAVRSYGELKRRAADAALKLDWAAVAEKCLASDDGTLIAKTLIWLTKASSSPHGANSPGWRITPAW